MWKMAFSCLVVVVVGIDVTAAPHNVVQIESLTWLTVIWFTFSPVHTLRAAIRVESVSWVKSSWAETATSRTSTLKQMIRRHNELGEYIVAINLNAYKKSFSFFFLVNLCISEVSECAIWIILGTACTYTLRFFSRALSFPPDAS